MTIYDPRICLSRHQLAAALEQMLVTANFTPTGGKGTEDIYVHDIPQVPGATIYVYTTIVDGECRASGKDAIRVSIIYQRKRDDKCQALIRETRVNRIGEVEAIVDRTLERMRSSYQRLKQRSVNGMFCSKCQAPLFTARSGNEVCAETCWA